MTTDRPTLHLCIATGQNLVNVIPALQLAATDVVILETPAMRAAASNLKTALESHGIAVRRRPFDDATPQATVAAAAAVALEFGERPLVFNATGGHKLMTLALSAELRLADALHVLYVETRHDRLDWLEPVAETEPMRDVLKLDDVLLAQGYRRVSDAMRDGVDLQSAHKRVMLTRRLGDDARQLGGFFGAMNSLADAALRTEGAAGLRQRLKYPPGGRVAEVLLQAQALQLIHWDGDTDLVFLNREAAAYFRGGWLEEYVAAKLRGIGPSEHGVNLKVEHVASKTGNELDALVVHRNRVLVIECKTARIGRDTEKDQNYIYKLDQLARQVGGSMSRSLFLSARAVQPDIRQRAAQYGVDVLAGDEVSSLVAYITGWMSGRGE